MVVTTTVSPEFEKVGRVLAGGNVKSVCRAVFANPHLREEAVGRVSRIINDECASLCSKGVSKFWTATVADLCQLYHSPENSPQVSVELHSG